MPTNTDHEVHDASGDETDALDAEMALLAMSAGGDIGGPLQDLDLTTLTPEEKRALLAYLRHRLNFAPDLEEPTGDLLATMPEDAHL
ncbi:MAG: hypothetical protein H7Y38_07400 [Armatimonadetes bacterium]|nr:hypothetical protein [Armatimonadota bacterium]